GLVVDSRCGREVRHRQVAVRLLVVYLWRNQSQQFRLQLIQFGDARGDVAQLVGQRVDAVQRVEERPQRPTCRDVETVWLPIEVVAQRPEEIVEVGDLVAQVLGSRDRLLERLALLVGDGAR